MKKRVLCVFFCFLLFSYYGKSEVQDSLDIIFIRSLANTDPQNAQRLLDSVWGRKDIPDYQLYWVQADIYKHTSQYMLSIKYENLLLAEDSVQNNYSYFINATRKIGGFLVVTVAVKLNAERLKQYGLQEVFIHLRPINLSLAGWSRSQSRSSAMSHKKKFCTICVTIG